MKIGHKMHKREKNILYNKLSNINYINLLREAEKKIIMKKNHVKFCRGSEKNMTLVLQKFRKEKKPVHNTRQKKFRRPLSSLGGG